MTKVEKFPAEPRDKSAASFILHSKLRREREEYAFSKSMSLLPEFFDDECNATHPTPEDFEAFNLAHAQALDEWDDTNHKRIKILL